ncbi:NAD-dependent succinate-semialdehyde dehydrogenase [Oceanimonas doudoroffii]|uniref:Aldehyde dehydrogenase n=1 Tax=Oceanimonas doudoroffii TaxID=84158 RepID=G5CZC6_9GAMM|nr:NAD-dependent succinate-semialdehyde dehydrogenase [Oceanimonas doudoroffii]AEQ39081.1 aldehyde dehydrogenase [Oceanimonas doudoroffii]OXY82172.1 NAD-dependent succinate-semialdehyde dehydrogenase [Oceanimonas doudoroffii]
MKTYQLHIEGRWTNGADGVTEAVINPATEETVAQFCHATAADIDRAIASATQGLAEWKAVPQWEKGAILVRAAGLLRERKQHIAGILTEEQGKPLAEALGEVERAADFIEWGGEEARRVAGRLINGRDQGNTIEIRKVPVGVVAAFAPWNFPVVLTAKKLAGLLGAGCSCVVKPAEETPGSAVELIKALLDAGVPGNTLNMVLGKPAEISSALIAHPAIRKITFTGSSPVGKLLAAKAGEMMKPVTMELGGHSPVIIFDDMDVDPLAKMLVAKKFFNAGQVCVSPTRFFVHESLYDQFVASFTEHARALTVGNGADSNTQMGPLANERRLQAMQHLVEDAVAKGAKVEVGGERLGDKGFFFAPTVLTNVSHNADLMSTEIFGPVVPILPFSSEEEVIAIANSVDYGLAAYFFTNNVARRRRVSEQLFAGTIGVNDVPAHIAEVPLGGWGDSGYGVEGGIEALESYMKSQYVSLR